MTWHIHDTSLLPHPGLAYCQLTHQKHISVRFQSKWNTNSGLNSSRMPNYLQCNILRRYIKGPCYMHIYCSALLNEDIWPAIMCQVYPFLNNGSYFPSHVALRTKQLLRQMPSWSCVELDIKTRFCMQYTVSCKYLLCSYMIMNLQVIMTMDKYSPL